MKNKRKKISIVVIFLICMAMFVGYFIRKQHYAHSSSTKRNAIVSDDKTKTSQVFKNEPVKKQELENKMKNAVASTSANNLKLKHNDKGLPILMYHAIGYEEGNTAKIPKEKFKEQMKYLKDNGYETLTLDEAYAFFINNKPVPEKSIVLTFDDGYVDNYVEALPILKELGFKATIFMITDLVDKTPGYMNLQQLKEMQAEGMDIQSHTLYHEHLKQLSYEKQVKTLKESKEFLEKSLNKKIQYLAYPYGEYSEETLKIVKEVGYTMALSTNGRWSDKADGILTLDRVFISGAANLDVFIERISNPNYKF
jgi:peptidoglycan/xylan/chitin deacetylase (PgdA/CDA1 family)